MQRLRWEAVNVTRADGSQVMRKQAQGHPVPARAPEPVAGVVGGAAVVARPFGRTWNMPHRWEGPAGA